MSVVCTVVKMSNYQQGGVLVKWVGTWTSFWETWVRYSTGANYLCCFFIYEHKVSVIYEPNLSVFVCV